MPESRSHKIASNRIAKKYGVDYNSQKGIDVNAPRAAIEVETESTVQGGLTQLQGHQKPVYIAGTNQAAVDRALVATKGTTVGVMNNQGKIIKRSTRKRK